MKRAGFIALIALSLTGIIGGSFAIFALWPREQTQVYADTHANTPVPHALTPISFTPSALTIPHLGLSLQIDQGSYDTHSQTWTLNDHDAFINAAQPIASSQDGAPLVFIYGHNTNAVLGRTVSLQPGDTLLLTDGEHTLTYRFTQAFLVEPTDTNVVTDPSNGNLALLSCNGLLSETRRVMYFDLIGAQ